MWRQWVNTVICQDFLFIYFLLIFFVSADPTFSSLFLFFNLYPRISIPIQLKMTAQFCGFHLPSSFYWGLAPYLALGIIHILMGSFPVTAHGTLGVRLEPWPLMRHAEIYATGKKVLKTQGFTSDGGNSASLPSVSSTSLFYFQVHYVIFPSFLSILISFKASVDILCWNVVCFTVWLTQVLCKLNFRYFFKPLCVAKNVPRVGWLCFCGRERIKDEWEVER